MTSVRMLLTCVVLSLPARASAQTAAPAAPREDTLAIRQAALDYIEGWHEGDAVRMARAVHPELAKRWVSSDPGTGRSALHHIGASNLIAATARGGSTAAIPPARRTQEVTILDIDGDIANLKVTSPMLVDYLQLARADGRWRIINVLFANRPD